MSGLQHEAMPHLNEGSNWARAWFRSVLEKEYAHLTREEDRIRAADG